jgi:hypothetical protein
LIEAANHVKQLAIDLKKIEAKSCPCTFISIKGVASCGTHKVDMRHTEVGWACPVSAWMFPFGMPLQSSDGAQS